MAIQFRKAQRKRAKIKIALEAYAGFGKTHSALLLAAGLVGEEKAYSRREDGAANVAVLDTENGSAEIEQGKPSIPEFDVITLSGNFHPKKYQEVIAAAVKAGYEALILDSLTHEWEGPGGILSMKDAMGGQYTAWAKLTPLHNALVNDIVAAPIHILATMRTKSDVILEENSKGKMAPKKVGTKAAQRDGTDFEFGIVFDIDNRHLATVSKDRTSLFVDEAPFLITTETGAQIAEWLEGGAEEGGAVAAEVETPQVTEPQAPAAPTSAKADRPRMPEAVKPPAEAKAAKPKAAKPKAAPKAEPAAADRPTGAPVKILSVEQRDVEANGKTFTAFWIKVADGAEYPTMDPEVADAARNACEEEAEVVLDYAKGKNGKMRVSSVVKAAA